MQNKKDRDNKEDLNQFLLKNHPKNKKQRNNK